MSNEQIILISILSIIIGVTASVGFIFPFLKSKGINVGEILNKLQAGLEEVKTGLAVIKEVAPDTPQLETLETIEKGAEIGVKYAQQMYISSQLPADQRKPAAIDTIRAILIDRNITITPNLEKFINDTVESKVFDLKTPEEIKAQETKTVQNTTTALQQQVTQLTADKAQLQTVNTQLTQKLTAVTQAVAK